MLRALTCRSLLASALLLPLTTVSISCEGESPKAFSPKEFRSFPIRKIRAISPNTKAFEIALPSDAHEMGMDVASFVMVKGPLGADGKPTMRPYTPTTTNDEKGFFELVIKTYPTGVVSSYLHSLKEGDLVEVKGPLTKFKYVPNMKKHIGMIAGGSGLTPMLQVLKEVVKNPADTTKVSLIFANNAEVDILLKDELDAIAAQHPDRVKIYYVLSQPSNKWTGYKGFVSMDLVKQAMPAPAADHLVLVCGPPGFMDHVSGNKTPDYKQGQVAGLLKAAGYTEDMVFKF